MPLNGSQDVVCWNNVMQTFGGVVRKAVTKETNENQQSPSSPPIEAIQSESEIEADGKCFEEDQHKQYQQTSMDKMFIFMEIKTF